MSKARITEITLYSKGLGRVLQATGVVNDYAKRLADSIRADHPDDEHAAFVSYYTTDRKAAMVTTRAEYQAKDGALTRAAAKVGLEVRAR